jgi:hypothetical protein
MRIIAVLKSMFGGGKAWPDLSTCQITALEGRSVATMVVSAGMYEAGIRAAKDGEQGFLLNNGDLYFQGIKVYKEPVGTVIEIK